jgi:hypothetical protein
MGHLKADRPVALVIAAVLGAALVGATLLSPATNVAQAQTKPTTAANGVLLPPMDYDPVAARNEGLAGLAESAVAPATPTPAVDPTDGSTVTDAPVDATDPPEGGNSVTTSLGGSDVAVSSVGGSYEVDRPKKRSERNN